MTDYFPPLGSVPTLGVPDLSGIRRLHMIGIGGAGMRNLARLFLARGIEVSGSDLKPSHGVDELRTLGAEVTVGHDAANLRQPDAVIASSAIPDTNPELGEARRRGIQVWARAQALAAAAADRREIAVAGTHGKTTTTSMIALVLDSMGLEPTYVIGGDTNETGSGARAGAGDLFVSEADESDGSFLLCRPEIGVITNVDVDHVDFYEGGRAEIEAAFVEFACRCDHLVACADDEGTRRVLSASGTPHTLYGTAPGSGVRLEISSVGPGGARAAIVVGEERSDLHLPIDGAHNLLDAAASVAVATRLGLDLEPVCRALGSFTGVHRRFELRGRARGADFYDDYGHVPTELAVTLDVARRMTRGRLVAVFQPHRYSRTQALWRELGQSLVEADLVVVTDVYGAAQEPIPGVTGKLVVEGVARARAGPRVAYLPHRDDVVAFLDREVRAGDLVVTMGCGDVWMLGDAARAHIGEDA